jgi:hypothetical protein
VKQLRPAPCAALALAALLAACSDESGGGGFSVEAAPRIEVSESGRPVLNEGTISVSGSSPTFLDILNTGNGPLNLRAVEIISEPPGAFTVSAAAPEAPLPAAGAPVLVAPAAIPYRIAVAYDASAAAATGVARPTARLTLRSNQTLDGTNVFHINVAPVVNAARLVLQPALVEFGLVQAGQSGIKNVALLNMGTSDLVITGFNFSGHPNFSMELETVLYNVSAESASTGITLAAPIIIKPGEARQMTTTYTATGEEAASGNILFRSNDPQAPNGTNLQLVANGAGPCVRVNPSRVDFGGKAVGQRAVIDVEITSCSDKPLEIRALEIADDPAGVYDVDTSALTFPLTLDQNASVTVPVSFTPTTAALFEGGEFVRETGLLRITSNAIIAEYDVQLSGFGTDGSCPQAVITVTEGDEVLPQTNLHLSARNSTATAGQITRWEWSVVQPQGSASVFFPATNRQDVTFEANIVGEYLFRLKVWDALGTESCSQAEYTVIVTSDEAIRVELLWNTPSDSNQSDTGFDAFMNSAGTDVDLHFLHPRANGQWFDSKFDCSWVNKNPDWGGAGTSDNPRLDRDDTDGAGPENLNLSTPEFGTSYTVGAHYWDDWSFGMSETTVRVYIYGQRRFQWDRVPLNKADMWTVARIEWPSQNVTGITTPQNGPVIERNFVPPIF